MEFWTRPDGRTGWKQWPDEVQGLAALLEGKRVGVLLVSDRPDDELKSLTAVVRLLRRLCGGSVSITAASPCPSRAWIESLKESGIDHVWVIDRPRPPGETRLRKPELVESPAWVCPALHARTSRGTAASVCGEHCDRMLLSREHLDHWCLGNHAACPHRRGGGDD